MRKANEPRKRSQAMTTATFKAPKRLITDFRAVAQSNERTLSQELRQIMAEHIEQANGNGRA
jgi:hypothetical protein